MDINIGQLFISLLVLIFSLTVHESAHAWAADRLGDPTARLLGRVSLNPVVHVDPDWDGAVPADCHVLAPPPHRLGQAGAGRHVAVRTSRAATI